MNGRRVLKLADNFAAAVGLALVLVSAGSWAQTSPDPGQCGYGHMMWGGGSLGMMIVGSIFMILILVAAVAAVVLLIRGIGGPGHWQPPNQTLATPAPLDILKERYARGEIDKDEFEERRRMLND